MIGPVNFVLRCAAIVAAAGLSAAALPRSPASASSPYVSALSGLAARNAHAVPSSCRNSGCSRYGHCAKARDYNCRYAAGECDQSPC
jgi:hypothetical protein